MKAAQGTVGLEECSFCRTDEHSLHIKPKILEKALFYFA